MLINSKNKTLILIVGPTAVGKTRFAIDIAKEFKTEIISCDSRQCYEELNIGVARPTNEELAQAKHYFIASHSIYDSVNAGVFEQYALTKVEEIFAKSNVAVMVGGTGLYANAFCNGIDSMPVINTSIRQDIIDKYNINGLVWLQNEIANRDPKFWQQAEQQNPQRLMRALEIVIQTGSSILSYKKNIKANRNFDIVKIGLELPRQELIERINKRVDLMLQEGLVSEVKSLITFKDLNALQTVGYTEMFAYLNNQCSLEEAIEKIKIHTRQYAKRQMTWFKKDETIQWMNPFEKLKLEVL